MTPDNGFVLVLVFCFWVSGNRPICYNYTITLSPKAQTPTGSSARMWVNTNLQVSMCLRRNTTDRPQIASTHGGGVSAKSGGNGPTLQWPESSSVHGRRHHGRCDGGYWVTSSRGQRDKRRRSRIGSSRTAGGGTTPLYRRKAGPKNNGPAPRASYQPFPFFQSSIKISVQKQEKKNSILKNN